MRNRATIKFQCFLTAAWLILCLPLPCAALKPKLIVQTGHSKSVNSVAFSPDGKTLASASSDTIKLWDMASGNELRALTGHSNEVYSVAFSPDSKTLAAAGGDKTIKLWDVASGKEVRTLTGCSSVSSIAFSPDGKTLAVASDSVRDKTIKLWEVASGKMRALTGHSSSVYSVAFSPDSKTLASASDDKTIKLWDVASGKESRTLTGHSDSVKSVAFSPDGKTLASASDDKTIKLWDVASGKESRTLSGHYSKVSSVAFSPDGKTIASGSWDKTIKLWDVASGKIKVTRQESTKLFGYVSSVTFSPDGKTLASASSDTIKFWEVASAKESRSLTGHSSRVNSVAFSPDGRTLASASSDNTTMLWDVASGKGARALTGHSSFVFLVAFSPDGKTLASASSDNTIKLWEVASGKELRALTGHSFGVKSVAFSPDGKTLASGSGDKTIKLWDVASGNEVRTLTGHSSEVCSVAFSPDGKTLASASASLEHTIKLWEVASGKELRTLAGHSHSVMSVAFSPDGKTLASASASNDKAIKLWEVASGKELRSLTGHSSCVSSVAFSPDGKTLASASWDKTIKLWEVASGKELRALTGHTFWVSSVAFSPDGKTLASASDDATIRLWNSATGAEIASLCACGNTDWAVVTSEGRFDASNLEQISSLAWVLPDDPMRALPLEIFMQQYFEPNLLARSIIGETLPPIKSIAELNRVQPEVTISSITPHSGSNDLVDIVVSFKSKTDTQPGKGKLRSGVYDLRLFRDGQLVSYLPAGSFSSKSSVDLSRDSDKFLTHTFAVKLPHNGTNNFEFTAYAFNADKVKSQTSTKEFKLVKPLEPKKARAYVIAFGVNVFDDSSWNLRYAAADAREFTTNRGAKSNLVSQLEATRDYTSVTPITLVSDKEKLEGELPATKAYLQDVFAVLSGGKPKDRNSMKYLQNLGVCKAEPEDFVLIAFSTHGATIKETGEFYLFPQDIGKVQMRGLTPDLQTHAISTAELTDWLKDVDASDIAMIIDACHSGAASGKDFKPGPMDSAGLGQLVYYKRMRLLSATQAADTAKETSTLGHGLLTFALLKEGLATDGRANLDTSDKAIRLKEWLQFARNEVPKLDSGGYRNRSIDEAMSGQKDVGIVWISKKNPHYFQTPSLIDFSRKTNDVRIVDLER